VVLIGPRDKNFLAENSEYIDSKKTIIVYSKSDLMKEPERKNAVREETIFVSSFSGEGIDNLKSKIVEITLKK
jgi:tRNA U34 5-carboxymethylaminomethyl modifying GTPase MnmE/TrmE